MCQLCSIFIKVTHNNKMNTKYEHDILQLLKQYHPDIYNELDKKWRIEETNRRLKTSNTFRFIYD